LVTIQTNYGIQLPYLMQETPPIQHNCSRRTAQHSTAQHSRLMLCTRAHARPPVEVTIEHVLQGTKQLCCAVLRLQLRPWFAHADSQDAAVLQPIHSTAQHGTAQDMSPLTRRTVQ
jgi:hypothetical protein